ncbi:MAG TPA: M3 family metallopeptidase [Lacunisphaera sp.]|jgi:oligopeptidase A|nr:M3 family metallopeptidase [Lacunisphaera sp.]
MEPAFLDRSFAIRWSQLNPDQVEPSLEGALAAAARSLDDINAVDPAQATYQNTFLALEETTDLLNETWAKVVHLTAVADSPALRVAYNRMLPKVTAFYTRIPLNRDLWVRLKAAAGQPASQALQGVARRFVDETLADFRQQGAELAPEKQRRLEALQSELAGLTQKFSENVLDATNGWELVVRDEGRLAGIPSHAREAARLHAQKKGLGTPDSPAWRFTLHAPSQEPVMLHAEDANLRREMWQATCAVGIAPPQDNRDLVRRIVALRQERAELLGFANFADSILNRRMAKSGDRALAFVEDLHGRVAAAFARETRELAEFKAARTGAGVAPLAPWEVGFWAEKLRKERYDFDDEQLRPYFPLAKVIEGMFETARRLFGVTVKAAPAGYETWHPEVKLYELRDEQGRHLGSFYTDWHPRESKRGGAWMNHLITGGPQPDGVRRPHLGLLCGNLTAPMGDRPALLNHREVETVFHEFGHLLHHLLGEVEIKSLNGTNVAWDFVELPSQIMENWCWERTSLDLFARHHETGAPIPEDLFQRMRAARNFRSASATMRQLAFARLDLELHLNGDRAVGDLGEHLRRVLRDYLMPTEPPAPTVENRFTHLFADPVGYAAAYYSYKWAEVLDADAFTRFQREGIFSRQVGADFVRHILSRGNSAEPMHLFVGFMGREPDLNALLRRAGLA